MKIISKLALYIFILLICFTSVNAADIKYSPTSEFFVNDFANILSDQTEAQILNIGKTVEAKTTAQLVVVTVPNMNGSDIESFANKLFNSWGIGSKEKNNGVLLILSAEDRKIRIEVGYGLEGAINDAKAGRILDRYAITSLKNNSYDEAVTNTIVQIQGEIYNEYGIDNSIENPNYVPDGMDIDSKTVFIVLGIFLLLVILTKGSILKVLFYGFMFFGGRGGSSGRGSFGGGGSSGGGGASRGF